VKKDNLKTVFILLLAVAAIAGWYAAKRTYHRPIRVELLGFEAPITYSACLCEGSTNVVRVVGIGLFSNRQAITFISPER
jgi:hypothetical protein